MVVSYSSPVSHTKEGELRRLVYAVVRPAAYSHGNYRCMHGNYYNSYFFFWAFSAALVTLPA